MEMAFELLIPGMQNSHKARFSTKLVFSKLKQGLGDSFKEHIEGHGFVLYDDGVQLMRQGKYDVKVSEGQHF
jgi:hypothetical protein